MILGLGKEAHTFVIFEMSKDGNISSQLYCSVDSVVSQVYFSFIYFFYLFYIKINFIFPANSCENTKAIILSNVAVANFSDYG